MNTQLINNGTIAPGDSTGTLTVSIGTGVVTLNPSSVMKIEVKNASAFDRFTVIGSATLGGTLEVRLPAGYAIGAADVFTVVSTVNPITPPAQPALGTFANAADNATILSADGKAFFKVNYVGNREVRLSSFDLVGDFDNDGDLDAADIDALLRATPGTVPPALAQFDVDFNGVVVVTPGAANSDSSHWVSNLKDTAFGDANLDSAVNFSDLLLLAANYNVSTGMGWATGDFDGNNGVNFGDLLLLAANYNFGSAPAGTLFAGDAALAVALVPEPGTAFAIACGSIALITRRWR